MSFLRLNRWDWVAFVAALALLFTMAVDWYSTPQGDEARRIQRIEDPNAGPSGQIGREVEERAAERAEGAERNAYQPQAFIDGVLLALLFATVAFAIVAAFARAAGRRFDPPATPSAAASFVAAVAALLVAYRIVQQPGLDEGTTIKAGAWLSLLVLAVVALASSRALDLEEEGRAFRATEPPEASEANGTKPA